jgi:large subunit ribosomal protein L35
MPKLKTLKAAASRFRKTKTGKIMRGHQMSSHLKEKKNADRLRRHREPTQIDQGLKKKIGRMIPYGSG